MKVTRDQQEQAMREWLDIFGEVPEERQPGDMTAREISDLWKIDRNAIYKAVHDGKLTAVKVIDDSGKSIQVYRVTKV